MGSNQSSGSSSRSPSAGGHTGHVGQAAAGGIDNRNSVSGASKHFSTAEVSQLHEHFHRLAAASPNPTKITRDQFAEALSLAGISTDSNPLLFSAFDTSSSNDLDFREYIIGLGMLSRGTRKEKLLLSFQVYDVDRSGSISKAEMIDVLTKSRVATNASQFVEELYALCDVTGNGKLTYVEYLRAALKHPMLLHVLGEDDREEPKVEIAKDSSCGTPSTPLTPAKPRAQMQYPSHADDDDQLHFSTAEVSQLYVHFTRLAQQSARNPNVIYKNQFRELLAACASEWGSNQQLDALFDAFDADASGGVDFHQFIIGLGKISRGSPREKLALSFDVYDRDNTGRISTAEMASVLRDYGGDAPKSTRLLRASSRASIKMARVSATASTLWQL